MSSLADESNRDPNPLVKTIDCGNVLISIFENHRHRNGEETVYYTVKPSRGYRAPDGNWGYTNSFYKSHLPQLIYACQKAIEFLEHVDDSPF